MSFNPQNFSSKFTATGVSPLTRNFDNRGNYPKDSMPFASRIRQDNKREVDLIYVGSVRVVVEYNDDGKIVVDVLKDQVSPGTVQDYKDANKSIAELCTLEWTEEFECNMSLGELNRFKDYIKEIGEN